MTARAQLSLTDYTPPRDNGEPPRLADFDGESYSRALDRVRLNEQLWAVYRALLTGKRWTIRELTEHCERELGKPMSENGIGARLRDLRKERFGGFDIPKDRIGDSGTFVYWLRKEGA